MASNLFVSRVLVGDVRLIEDRTVYARTGDLVAYASLVVSLAAVVMGRRRAKQTSRP
jgi:apolipoprotein N-acyltransferase